jgi:hypothetical protein
MKKVILKVLIPAIILCIAVSLSGCMFVQRGRVQDTNPGSGISSDESTGQQSSPADSAQILKDFNSITRNMSLSDVNKLIGYTGIKSSSDEYELADCETPKKPVKSRLWSS